MKVIFKFDITMIKHFIICFCLILIAGCVGPDKDEFDRDKYSRYIAWENAKIVGEPDKYKILEIEYGSRIILELEDGYAYGKRTKTHASSKTVYFILNSIPNKNAYYTCTLDDGTLDFAGAEFGFCINIDNMKPAEATLHVIDVTDREIIANVEGALWYYGKPKEKSHLYAIKDTIRFKRMKLNAEQ